MKEKASSCEQSTSIYLAYKRQFIHKFILNNQYLRSLLLHWWFCSNCEWKIKVVQENWKTSPITSYTSMSHASYVFHINSVLCIFCPMHIMSYAYYILCIYVFHIYSVLCIFCPMHLISYAYYILCVYVFHIYSVLCILCLMKLLPHASYVSFILCLIHLLSNPFYCLLHLMCASYVMHLMLCIVIPYAFYILYIHLKILMSFSS